MSFAEPGSLVLLLLAPLAAVVAAGLWWRWHRGARQWIAPYLWHRLLPGHDARLTVATVALLALAVAGLALALARPQRPAPSDDPALLRPAAAESELRTLPGDVVLALDTSYSMAAEDVRPSRMAMAHRALRELTTALPEHRLALVQWEAEPRVVSPLTADHGLVLVQAEGLEPGSMERPGSALAPAVEVASDLLSSNPSAATGPRVTSERPRAIVVLTDGEDHAGGSGSGLTTQLAEVLRSSGITVHGVLVGTEEGSLLPLPEGGFKRDSDGQEVVSRAREEPLRSLVQETGGVLLRAERADTSFAPLVQGLRSVTAGDEPSAPVRETFQAPLLLAALALLGHLLLGDGRVELPSRQRLRAGLPTGLLSGLRLVGDRMRDASSAGRSLLLQGLRWARRRWRARGTAALLCLLALPWISGQAPASPTDPSSESPAVSDSARATEVPQELGRWQSKRRLSRTAAEAYANGDPVFAAAAARAALDKDPDDPTLLFNAGTARLAAEPDATLAADGDPQRNSETALEQLERAARTADGATLAADAWYNLGTARLAAGERQQAVQALEEALRRNPEHQSARLNLEWALRPPPEPPSPPDPQPEDDSPSSDEEQPSEPSPESGAGSPTKDPRSAGDRFQPQPDLSPEAARSLLRAVEDLERGGHRQDSQPRRRSTGARDW
jgi:Ca-activated chloride channel family protein